jgi:hypothetical protein
MRQDIQGPSDSSPLCIPAPCKPYPLLVASWGLQRTPLEWLEEPCTLATLGPGPGWLSDQRHLAVGQQQACPSLSRPHCTVAWEGAGGIGKQTAWSRNSINASECMSGTGSNRDQKVCITMVLRNPFDLWKMEVTTAFWVLGVQVHGWQTQKKAGVSEKLQRWWPLCRTPLLQGRREGWKWGVNALISKTQVQGQDGPRVGERSLVLISTPNLAEHYWDRDGVTFQTVVSHSPKEGSREQWLPELCLQTRVNWEAQQGGANASS